MPGRFVENDPRVIVWLDIDELMALKFAKRRKCAGLRGIGIGWIDMKRLLSAGIVSLLILAPVQASLAASDLAPHRALYRMSLVEANPSSGISAATGAMMYRFEDICDAWTSETKVILKLIYAEGDEIQTTWSFTSWEAKNGLSYRFNVRHSRNGNDVEVLEGHAKREEARGPATATFTVPKDTTIKLPDGTLFPTRHLVELIKAGQKNTLTVSEVVFDGASLENPYQINALITKPKAKSTDTKAARHIRMAFFPILAKAEEPEFELGITYRPDGVAERIRQDFGDFSLNLVPDNIEVLSKPDC